jgi:4a-hydroxytetrahydrobiopterin dehydratase
MTLLADKTCIPCRGGVPPLTEAEQAPLVAQLHDWAVIGGHHLRREFRFADFAAALAWVNRIGAIAEAQGHHPDIALAWGRVVVEIWTHKIDGLSESDFILAARIDRACADG